MGLITASRNLDFFTSYYRYLIQLLPAAVVAPLFFQVCVWRGVGCVSGGGGIGDTETPRAHRILHVCVVVCHGKWMAGEGCGSALVGPVRV